MKAPETVQQRIAQSGIPYQKYIADIQTELSDVDPSLLSEKDAKYYGYKKLNLKRMERIEKRYTPSSDMVSLLSNLDIPMTWMLITESWCGDSAQTLPYIARIAAAMPKTSLQILSRDNHPEIMDLYLTNGSRSIPKLVAFDSDWNEIFQWGPRPEEAMELARELKESGLSEAVRAKEIQGWYNRNKGSSLEREFIQVFETLLNPA